MFRKFKLNKDGLIPVITQEIGTGKVLMQAYMNEEAFNKTINTKKVHYFSRSRQKLWLKGETSHNYQTLKEMKIDCDLDCLLLIVEQQGNACHTGNKTCFYRNIIKEGDNIVMKEKKQQIDILKEVYNVIQERKNTPIEGSYTNYLFTEGIDKILKKVGEESAEVIIASKNSDNNEVIYEISDLMYHLMVLMVERNVEWEDVYSELDSRRSK